MKIGYKGTYNYICRSIKYNIGEIYSIDSPPILCSKGFHYCKKAEYVLNYYIIKSGFKLLEIEDLGDTIESIDKSVSNKIRIIREISDKEELLKLFSLELEFDNNGNLLYYKNKYNFWVKKSFDELNRLIYHENSYGYWFKIHYNDDNSYVYENSYGKTFVS